MKHTNNKIPFIVAVYGSLREGYGNHRLLINSQKYGGTFLTDELFDLYSFGGFPAITLNGSKNIVVELYKIDNELTAKRLDMLEGYPDFYNKKTIKIKDFTSELPIYIYYIEDISTYTHVTKLNNDNDWNQVNKR